MMTREITGNTPIAMLTVDQLRQVIFDHPDLMKKSEPKERRYVYGIAGLAELFQCSIPTANRIKASGAIDSAITQIGRKIMIDADLAVELAGKKKGGLI